MPGWHSIVRRRYSAISTPPIRGFVFTTIADEEDGVWVDRYPIQGVCACTTATWTRKAPELEGHKFESFSLSPNQLQERGFHPEHEDTEVIPVILASEGRGEHDDESDSSEFQLVILTEFLGPWDTLHKTVWCTWPESEDERRLEPVVRQLKAEFMDSEKRKADRAKKTKRKNGDSAPS